MTASAGALSIPLKCTPEESKHFVEPALAQADQSNYVEALDIVSTGLNAHPASEGLLFLKAYLGYKLAELMSSQLTKAPKAIETLGADAVLVDGGATTALLDRFDEILQTLGDAENAVEELQQVSPANEDVVAFKRYIRNKIETLSRESGNLRTQFIDTPKVAGGFCTGCKKSISFDTQSVVFRKVQGSLTEVWHMPCFRKLGTKN